MVQLVPVVLVLLCTFSCTVSGLPFEKKAYLNETDGLLYVPGMGYDIPDTHIFNGSSVSNRHSEHELALPKCPGSSTFVESRCNSPTSGWFSCRSARTGGLTSTRFQCSSSEFCATFLSANNERRDSCVSRNFYIIQLALSWNSGTRDLKSKRNINGENQGVSTFMASSDLSFYVTPNLQILKKYQGNSVQQTWNNHDSPQAINVGAGPGAGRAVEIEWGIAGGQDVNAFMALYKTS